MGHVGSNTMSLGQILEKPCLHSRGQILNPMIMNLGQNVCLDKISDEYENGSCRVKHKVTKSNLRITFQKAQVSDSRAIMALLLV